MASHRWSSVSTKTMLGRAAGLAAPAARCTAQARTPGPRATDSGVDVPHGGQYCVPGASESMIRPASRTGVLDTMTSRLDVTLRWQRRGHARRRFRGGVDPDGLTTPTHAGRPTLAGAATDAALRRNGDVCRLPPRQHRRLAGSQHQRAMAEARQRRSLGDFAAPRSTTPARRRRSSGAATSSGSAPTDRTARCRTSE